MYNYHIYSYGMIYFVSIHMHLHGTHIDHMKLMNTHMLKPCFHLANTSIHLTIMYSQTTQVYMRIWMIAWPAQKTTLRHRSTDIQHQDIEENGPDRVKTEERDPDPYKRRQPRTG